MPRDPDNETPRTRTIVVAIVTAAAFLRIVNANAELWYDEIVTVLNFVRAPFAQVVSSYGLANNHVMNSVLVNLVGTSLGTSPWLLRLPAIAFGIAGVWAFWFVASVLWSRTPALVGTALFAGSYHHIYYSQNARGYSALIFFALLAAGCALRVADRSTRTPPRHAIGYVLAIGCGLYAMLLMAFVVAGHGVTLAAARRWRALGLLAAGAGVGVLLYAPMAGSLVEYYRIHPADTGYPLLSLAFARAIAPLAPAMLLAVAIMLPVLWRFWRRQPLAAALLLAPLAFNLLVPLLRGQGVYPRSFIYALPVAYLLLIEALDWTMHLRPTVAWLAAGAVALVSLAKLVPFYQLPKQGFRQALAFVESNIRTGDERLGLTLGGKAARFYDARYVLIEDTRQLEAQLRRAPGPAWIVWTFPGALTSAAPDLARWVHTVASDRAEFPGVIGDGTVHVSYWPGDPRAR